MSKYKKRRLGTHPRIMISRLLSRWPFYVWMLAIVVAFVLYTRTSQFGGMPGVVETFEEPVAALDTARLKEIYVIRGQRVKAGQPLAQLDTAELDARIAVDEAKILEAQGTLSSYQQDVMEIVREFNNNIRDAESELETGRIELMKDQAELKALKTELQRREALKAKNLLSEQDVSSLRPKIAALEESIVAYPRLIELREKRLAEITIQRDELFAWLNLEQSGAFSEAVKEQMTARNAILNSSISRRHMQRESYTLRAASDGVVSRILKEPGSVVKAGDPVLLLVSERSEWVVGFLPEVYITDLKEGQEAVVERQNGVGGKVKAVVEAISPEIRALPGRISPIQNQPLRGRRVMVKLEEDDVFVPGETVRIRIPFHFTKD